MSRSYRTAAVPGEEIEAGFAVLATLAEIEPAFGVQRIDLGGGHFLEHGRMMPADGVALLQPFDAILFGSAGWTKRQGWRSTFIAALIYGE